MNITEMLAAVDGLEGDYAECGVYQGRTAKMIHDGMNKSARLWLFDSFKGHAQPGEFDDAKEHPEGRYADTSYWDIKQMLPDAIIVEGFLPGTLVHCTEDKFRFVHIDVDHYLPTKAACEFFKPRMVKGGIIRFDDYKCSGCQGATKAVDEVFTDLVEGDWRWICH